MPLYTTGSTAALAPRGRGPRLPGGRGAARGGGGGGKGGGGKGDDDASGSASSSTVPSFFSYLNNDEDILKVLVQVMTGMREILPKLQKYLNQWDKYKNIWDVDKDAFMRRYAKANRALTAFETDIVRYKDVLMDIQGEEGVANIGFIRIDCQPLKQALSQHCHAWQAKFTNLLNANAAGELSALFGHMAECEATLKRRPANLDQLAEAIKLLEAEQGAYEKTEARFEPLETMYRMLEKFEVQVPEAELVKLSTLRGEWANYKATLHDAAGRLQKAKADFKDDLMQSLTDFTNHTSSLRNEFLRTAPFDAEPTLEQARKLLAEARQKVAEVRTREGEMAAGLGIFDIEPPANKETADTEKNLELLETIWGMVEEWQVSMDGWKYGKFASMDVGTIEAAASAMSKRIQKLLKEFKGQATWKVLLDLNARVDGIKKLMPLIMDLRNEAMRDRHWSQLMEEVGKTFDPHADTFTLERVLDLGLEHHAETVSNLSTGRIGKM